MERKSLLVVGIVALLSVFFITGVAKAQSVKSGDSVTVSKSQTVDSMLFASGRTILIEGTVNGDLFCAGQEVSISGTVKGDVFCAAQTLRITGQVDGSVRAAGQTVTYGADTQGSVSLAGQTVSLDEDAVVGRDLLIGASSVTMQGKVARDASIGAENALINGTIGRDLGGRYQTLTLGPSADVMGSIDVASNNNIVKDASAQVGGQVKRRDIPKEQNNKSFSLFGLFGFFVFMVISLLIVSLVLVLLFPRLFAKTNRQINLHKPRVIGNGLAMVFLLPFVLFALALSIVGIPLAGLVFAGSATLFMLSGPVAAFFVGSKIVRGDRSPFVTMLVGSLVILLLYLIPFLNIVLALAVAVFGTGALVSLLATRSKFGKQTVA